MLLFFKIMLTEFIAEMGDKTQLMLIALSSKYRVRDIVLGTAAAVMVLNGIAVLAGGLVSRLIPDWLIKLIAAAAFLYFAVTSLKPEDDEEEEMTDRKPAGFAATAVFSTFFVAELGDKTQLTAITFGANEGLSAAFIVWAACCVGLFAADMLGMAVGLLLKNSISGGLLNKLAFCIFTVFGLLTARQGLMLLTGADGSAVLPALAAVAAVFALICIVYFRKLNYGKERKM